ncbi:MAG TPA: antitoxin [Actinocrinis sp.]|uniref:antitoxin n=1 Tax=Actinocrinis sp. TaxID=1920516 RepID=UPI002DDCEFD1|nr:antitoxin [Actinocrinis sp.]HEV2344444.1 antitoxin [Actinocrinis sp.]
MGIFDFLKHRKGDSGSTGTTLKDRVTGMMAGHGDQVNQGLDKAGQMVDEKTGGKYTNQINKGVGMAKDKFGQQAGQASGEADADMPRPEPGTQGGDSAQPPQS